MHRIPPGSLVKKKREITHDVEIWHDSGPIANFPPSGKLGDDVGIVIASMTYTSAMHDRKEIDEVLIVTKHVVGWISIERLELINHWTHAL